MHQKKNKFRPIKARTYFLALFITLWGVSLCSAQVHEDKIGAWYMYFWRTRLAESSFGFQGDMQYRNWNLGGDLEQLLLRGGVTYTPRMADVTFTLGYAYILSGEFGDGNATRAENRIYQEALLPHKVGGRFYLTHRFRFEQRFVDDQDFRTRYRYNLILNVPLNQKDLTKGAWYLAWYNEVFINGQKDIGDAVEVSLFDRNRTYMALGYSISDPLKIQFGYMRQTSNTASKDQWQLSLHHTF